VVSSIILEFGFFSLWHQKESYIDYLSKLGLLDKYAPIRGCLGVVYSSALFLPRSIISQTLESKKINRESKAHPILLQQCRIPIDSTDKNIMTYRITSIS